MINRIDLQTALYGTKTYLKRDFFTRPFKLLPVSIDPNDTWLKVMMMSSSPGMLDGDQYEIRVELAEGTHLQLQTQSYQRLFRMVQGAGQTLAVTMQPNSRFYYIPHPSVPQQASIFRGHNRIQLSAGCRLIWGEIITCGRKLSGEEFAFTHFQNITEVYDPQRLIFKDYVLLSPGSIPLHGLGQYEGHTHQATLFFYDDRLAMPPLVEAIYTLLNDEPHLTFGITLTAYQGLLVRVLGQGGEQLYAVLHRIGQFLQAPQNPL